MHSKVSEVIHGSVLCLTLISLSGSTVSKIFVNISLKLNQASLIFEAKQQLSHLASLAFYEHIFIIRFDRSYFNVIMLIK
jgi:hypothetical protein